jgi:hypothetical protein
MTTKFAYSTSGSTSLFPIYSLTPVHHPLGVFAHSIGQTITPPSPYILRAIRLHILKFHPSNYGVTIKICGITGGQPNTPLHVQTFSIPDVSLGEPPYTPGDEYFLTYTLSKGIEVTSQFYVLIETSDYSDTNDPFKVVYVTSDVYAGGSKWTNTVGPWIADAGQDIRFEAWGDPVDVTAFPLKTLTGYAGKKGGYNGSLGSGIFKYGWIASLPHLNGSADIVHGGRISQYTLKTLTAYGQHGSGDLVENIPHGCNMQLFKEEPLQVQSVYVVGRDYTGNPVYGSADDNAITGTKVDIGLDDAISTYDDANKIADNILYNSRLNNSRGFSQFSPHLALELLDVVSHIDDVANKASGVDLRLAAFKLKYDNEQGQLIQSAIWTSV